MYKQLCNEVVVLPTRRKIGKTYSSVSGIYPFRGEMRVPFESTLERDFLVRLEIDNTVLSVESQPFTLEYFLDSDRKSVYTPDFLVTYKSSSFNLERPSELIEVKSRDLLLKRFHEFRPRYKAAMRYCQQESWVFHLMHEDRIRDQYWRNAMFLQRYRKMNFTREESEHLIDYLRKRGVSTFEMMLGRHFPGKWVRAEGISHLWYLVAHGFFYCDLSLPLSSQTELWLSGDIQ